MTVAHVAMPPNRVQEAYAGFMREYVANFGENALERAWEIVEEARGRVASLVGCRAHEIGFVKNTCEGISILAQGYPFEPGDNVIVADQEHSSTLFAWINLHEQKGIELRVVKSQGG